MSLLSGIKERNVKKKAKSFYLGLPTLKLEPREVRKLKALMSSRLTAFIDTTFIEGAHKTEALQKTQPLNSRIKMESAPFKNVKTVGGVVCVYLPPKYTNYFFELGSRYQSAQLTINQVLELADKTSLEISESLDLQNPIHPLNFLRSDAEEENEEEVKEETDK
ncbi:MAG: hypothetical protein ACJ0Q6_03415 [Candidatus Azotimanducaceae bacterium]|uniref:Uncharacterized protein n=1 Tax=OM182 bacterium TaxID=2510334 RepID=A0A520S0Z2_9GAMM|nr:hypothetical protein [Gammaproteobacteria bacterium]OUV67443.1 MAG: hypothetical protein CBC93_05315 [Gammaproteobacteria bacterium TMED133]RZO76135.1 MAG: hypothetical protein EVA68_05150 [OM182 bacterium]